MAKTRSEQRDQGRAVLERLAQDKAVPAQLKPLIKAFATQQKGVEAARKQVEAARAARDAALDEVGGRDAALDKQVDVLADRLVGAELGPRKNPFAPFGGRAPAVLKEIAYTTEVEEVLALVATIKKKAKKPPQPVTAALAQISTLANASKKALIALVAPQTAYVDAISAHDELLVEWTRAFERLRAHAKALCAPGAYAAVFAPPDAAAKPPTPAPAPKPKASPKPKKPAAPPAAVAAPPPASPQPTLPFVAP